MLVKRWKCKCFSQYTTCTEAWKKTMLYPAPPHKHTHTLLTQLILMLLWISMSFGANFDASVSLSSQGCFLDMFLLLLPRAMWGMWKGKDSKHSPHYSQKFLSPGSGFAGGQWAHGEVRRSRIEPTNDKLGAQSKDGYKGFISSTCFFSQ